jgi:Zn-dependent protease
MSISDGLIYLLAIVFSAILHEIAHGVVAEYFGDSTARDAGRITLNPLPHIDPVFTILVPLVMFLSGSPILFGAAKPVPVNYWRLSNRRWGVFWVSMAGIITNLILAFAFSVPLRFGGINQTVANVLFLIVEANIVLAVINMIPIPPIDGSKALAALFGEKPLEKVLSLEYHGIWGVLPFMIVIYILFLTPLFTSVITPVMYFFFHIFGIA